MVITPFNESNSFNFDTIESSFDFTQSIQNLNAGFRKIIKNRTVKNSLYVLIGIITLPLIIVLTPFIHLYFYKEYLGSKKFYKNLFEILDAHSEKEYISEESRQILTKTLDNSQTMLSKLNNLPSFSFTIRAILPFVWYINVEKDFLLKLELKLRLLLHPEENEAPLNYHEILELQECMKDFDLPLFADNVA